MITNRMNIPTMALPQAINFRDVREIPGFGNTGGGGVPIHTGGIGVATADTGAPQFPQNRAPSTLRKPHRVQIGMGVTGGVTLPAITCRAVGEFDGINVFCPQ
jgi:hypothetical protein